MTSRRPSTSGVPRSFSSCSAGTTSPRRPERLLVDDEQVGPEMSAVSRMMRVRISSVCSTPTRRLAESYSPFDLLDDARDAHEVDARAELVGADDRRARQDQDRDVVVGLDQGVGDRAAAAHMAEAERVVAVDQHTLGPAACGHAGVSLLAEARPAPTGVCGRTMPYSDGPREPPVSAMPKISNVIKGLIEYRREAVRPRRRHRGY